MTNDEIHDAVCKNWGTRMLTCVNPIYSVLFVFSVGETGEGKYWNWIAVVTQTLATVCAQHNTTQHLIGICIADCHIKACCAANRNSPGREYVEPEFVEIMFWSSVSLWQWAQGVLITEQPVNTACVCLGGGGGGGKLSATHETFECTEWATFSRTS